MGQIDCSNLNVPNEQEEVAGSQNMVLAEFLYRTGLAVMPKAEHF
jgi:hypothetical protein